MNKNLGKWRVSDKVKCQTQNLWAYLHNKPVKKIETTPIFPSQFLVMEKGILTSFVTGHRTNKNMVHLPCPSNNMANFWVNSVFWRTKMIQIWLIILAKDDSQIFEGKSKHLTLYTYIYIYVFNEILATPYIISQRQYFDFCSLLNTFSVVNVWRRKKKILATVHYFIFQDHRFLPLTWTNRSAHQSKKFHTYQLIWRKIPLSLHVPSWNTK